MALTVRRVVVANDSKCKAAVSSDEVVPRLDEARLRSRGQRLHFDRRPTSCGQRQRAEYTHTRLDGIMNMQSITPGDYKQQLKEDETYRVGKGGRDAGVVLSGTRTSPFHPIPKGDCESVQEP